MKNPESLFVHQSGLIDIGFSKGFGACDRYVDSHFDALREWAASKDSRFLVTDQQLPIE
jgi:hypothetical protein